MNRPLLLVLVLLVVACAPQVPTTEPTPDATLPEEIPEEVLVEIPEPAPEEIYFTVAAIEGDLIELEPEAVDPDGDLISYTFTEPFTADGRWQTQIGDEGTYFVAVAASDGKSETVETVKVIVGRANRPPVVECNAPVRIREGEIVDLHDHCMVYDEDNEEVVVTYGGWMSGWEYQTTYDDAGEHTVVITASDRRDRETLHVVTQDVLIVVEDVNRAPVFPDDFPSVLSATENDVITLPRDAITDPDGDTVTFTYSAPFGKDGVWSTELGDAGTYTVDVVASDGDTTAKRTIELRIALLNTAPTLKEIGAITLREGETVELPISASDREGDPLTLSITGWMTTDTYRTTYADAGEHTVKVTVTDGVFTTSEVVTITVQDVNRPPVFVTPA